MSEAEELSPYEQWEQRIVCPVHGLKYRRESKSKHGGYFCAGKNQDGSWCNWYKTQRQISRIPLIINTREEAIKAGCELVYLDRLDFNDYQRRYLQPKIRRHIR